ncbi:MAG TPA: hypothetical protein VEF53_17810 [Patescibacteria group bacterium]|nr:hypothetical protein [Patescibacteria group bacterium]
MFNLNEFLNDEKEDIKSSEKFAQKKEINKSSYGEFDKQEREKGKDAPKAEAINKVLDKFQFLNDDRREIETAYNRVETKKDAPQRIEKNAEKPVMKDRLDIVRELEKEHKSKESEKVFVYKNDRQTLQQKRVERRDDRQSLNEYRQHIKDYNNGLTPNQRNYHYQKAMQYETRQQQKQHWDNINRQEYQMLKLNSYDKHIWNAAQDNRGILTEKALNKYADRTFHNEVDRDRFLNYCDMKLTKYSRIGMLNDKSQTALQRADAFGLVTNKTHTNYETRTVYFNDRRIDERLNEIESFIKDKGLMERVKFEFASAPHREVEAQKDRIKITLEEEKSAGNDYKDLYKDFLTNKDRNLNDMPKSEIKAEYEALRKLKEESAREIKIRGNYSFEVNQRFLNKVEEYEAAKLEREEKKIERHRDDIRYSPLAVFDKEIADYIDKNNCVLDNKIFDRVIEAEGRTRETLLPEQEQRLNLLKTRILDLKAAGYLTDRGFNQSTEGFEYVASPKYDLRDSEKSFGNELDREIYNFCEKHDKTFNFKVFEEELRDNSKELSDDEIKEKITVTQLRISQLYANDYLYKITDEIYVSKESFDNAIKLNEEYIKFTEGKSTSFPTITKESEKINNFSCKMDKDILANALNNNGIVDMTRLSANEEKAKIAEGRIEKLVKCGYINKSEDGKYQVTDKFEKSMREKGFETQEERTDRNYEKFEFRYSDAKYLNICRQQIESKGCFNLNEYKTEKYGKDDVKESELDKTDKFMLKRLKMIENAGLIKIDKNGNIIITERGAEAEKSFMEKQQEQRSIENYNRFEFTKHDHEKWFLAIRQEIKVKGRFNPDEYQNENRDEVTNSYLFKRINTMLAAGILAKNAEGNIVITERGLMTERVFLEGKEKPIIESPKAVEKPKDEVKFTSFDYSNIAVSVDENGVFSKEHYTSHFQNNDFVGAVGKSYRWTAEQIESKYQSAVKRLETFVENDYSFIEKLENGTYKLGESYIDRATIEFEKNSLKGNERSIKLNREQDATITDIGSFGQLTEAQTIIYIYGGKTDLYSIDIADLKRKKLIVTEKYNLKDMGEQTVIALTPKGRAIAEINTGKDRIATKSKLNKEGELAHDLYIYDTIKHLEAQLASENKKIEITYSDRQMKSFQQSILAREYDNIGLGVATVYILDKAADNSEFNRKAYEDEVRSQYSKEGFINKKLQSFDKTFEALESRGFIRKVDEKYTLTEKGSSLRNDLSTGRLQVMFSDCQVVVSDGETGELSTLNIEVDMGSYTDDEIKEKVAKVPNQLWATNSEKQRTKIQKYVSRSVFLLR